MFSVVAAHPPYFDFHPPVCLIPFAPPMSLPLTPSYTGFIGSTKDAVLVIQAVLRGDLPLVDHRPQDRERAELIKSGNVFVFIEESSGIKRWTDGISWSASRILGRFLVYRELDPSTMNEKDDKRKRRKHLELGPLRRPPMVDYLSDPTLLADYRRSHLDYRPFDLGVPEYAGLNAMNPAMNALNPGVHSGSTAPMGPSMTSGGTPTLNAYGRLVVARDKPPHVVEDHGLIKKTLSVTTAKENASSSKESKQTIHLISYYSAHDVLLGKLTRPSQGSLKNLEVPALLWDAVKKSSLGGKIPIEDEAYYFLDSNYQLQNMSVLLATRPDSSKKLPMTTSHQPVAKSLQPNTSKLPYVLPVPYSGPAPPIAFHADYGPPVFQLLAKPRAQNIKESLKKDDDSGELAPTPSYPVPTSFQTFNHSSNYVFPEQRSPEVLLLQLQFPQTQPSQHPIYDQLLHHHQQFAHHAQQIYPFPGPSGPLDHQYLSQESVYVPGYSGQYPGISYQMYNSSAYLNPGGGPILQPTSTNFSPGGNVPSLTSQQLQHQSQQLLQLSLGDPQSQPLLQAQQLLQAFDFSSGQRAGYYGGVIQLNPTGNVHPTAPKRSAEYPEYFAPADEQYNYN